MLVQLNTVGFCLKKTLVLSLPQPTQQVIKAGTKKPRVDRVKLELIHTCSLEEAVKWNKLWKPRRDVTNKDKMFGLQTKFRDRGRRNSWLNSGNSVCKHHQGLDRHHTTLHEELTGFVCELNCGLSSLLLNITNEWFLEKLFRNKTFCKLVLSHTKQKLCIFY